MYPLILYMYMGIYHKICTTEIFGHYPLTLSKTHASQASYHIFHDRNKVNSQSGGVKNF